MPAGASNKVSQCQVEKNQEKSDLGSYLSASDVRDFKEFNIKNIDCVAPSVPLFGLPQAPPLCSSLSSASISSEGGSSQSEEMGDLLLQEGTSSKFVWDIGSNAVGSKARSVSNTSASSQEGSISSVLEGSSSAQEEPPATTATVTANALASAATAAATATAGAGKPFMRRESSSSTTLSSSSASAWDLGGLQIGQSAAAAAVAAPNPANSDNGSTSPRTTSSVWGAMSALEPAELQRQNGTSFDFLNDLDNFAQYSNSSVPSSSSAPFFPQAATLATGLSGGLYHQQRQQQQQQQQQMQQQKQQHNLYNQQQQHQQQQQQQHKVRREREMKCAAAGTRKKQD